jgi:serine phosphatase RsbU (regulator of sigma subunit)
MLIVPLRARERTLGAVTLAATSSRRRYDEEDTDLALELARRAALIADNARLYDLQRNIAQTLQRSLLPGSLPEIPGMELAAKYRAAGEGNEVGGDFYDAFEVNGSWFLAIGDVCGKGPQAAAVTGLARHTLRAVALHEPRPSRVLATLNEAILRALGDHRFCTVCCLRVHPRGVGARVTVCSGGHPLPVVLRANGDLETAGRPSMLLGLLPDDDLADDALDLGPGDAVVLYTDGVVEQPREEIESGSSRLARVLREHAGSPAATIAEAVERSVTGHAGESLRDDIAVLVLRISPAAR